MCVKQLSMNVFFLSFTGYNLKNWGQNLEQNSFVAFGNKWEPSINWFRQYKFLSIAEWGPLSYFGAISFANGQVF